MRTIIFQSIVLKEGLSELILLLAANLRDLLEQLTQNGKLHLQHRGLKCFLLGVRVGYRYNLFIHLVSLLLQF